MRRLHPALIIKPLKNAGDGEQDAQLQQCAQHFSGNGGTKGAFTVKYRRMCGICGVIGIQRSELAEEITRRMMGALQHRGPDEDGILVAPSAALGMRRLSIIDLPGGHQPVFNETGNVAVIFNGEIYNFRQLRKTLEGRGHAFRTHSDTEVIVHAYEEWGEQCLRELRGMFAIAIWDARSSGTSGEAVRRAQILLARDRLGIKPLYYTAEGGALLFSSEVRSLLASGRIRPRLSPDSLEGYLTFGSVAEPSTLVKDVFSVPPGHFLAFSADATPANPSPKPYWIFSDAVLQQDGPRPKSLKEAAKLLRPLLEETVRDHLISDVPLGVFLSSGLDSTTLVALASRVQSDLHTFTVVFPEQMYSEAKISRETAKLFKTRHQEVLLSPDILVAQLEDAVKSLDQPTMDGLNTYFVSRAAHQAGLKVALSGLGSDEIFGGYSTFISTPRAAFVAGLGRWVPGPFRRLTAAAAVRIAAGDAVRKAAASWRSPRTFRMHTISRGFCSRLLVCGACLLPISNPTNIPAIMTIPGVRACERRRDRPDGSIPLPPFPVSNCSHTW